MNRDSNFARYKAEWVEGRPERSFWSGFSVRGRKRTAVHARRCGKCGLLELYASD
jgi:S-adenosylmethionine:diacylglycerol 3-amino-3-carboxypropyl transferase